MNFHGFYISRWKLEPASQKSDLLVNRIEVIEKPDTQLAVTTLMMVRTRKMRRKMVMKKRKSLCQFSFSSNASVEDWLVKNI